MGDYSQKKYRQQQMTMTLFGEEDVNADVRNELAETRNMTFDLFKEF